MDGLGRCVSPQRASLEWLGPGKWTPTPRHRGCSSLPMWGDVYGRLASQKASLPLRETKGGAVSSGSPEGHEQQKQDVVTTLTMNVQ